MVFVLSHPQDHWPVFADLCAKFSDFWEVEFPQKKKSTQDVKRVIGPFHTLHHLHCADHSFTHVEDMLFIHYRLFLVYVTETCR